MPTTTKPATRKPRAAKPATAKPKPAKATKPTKPAKPAAKKTTERKPPRFDPAITAAVAYARKELHAAHTPEGKHTGAASGGDHIRVRTAITKAIGTDHPTVKQILTAIGVKSVADLERAARFEDVPNVLTAIRDADVMKSIRADAGGNVGWRSGRYACGILAAWCREIKTTK